MTIIGDKCFPIAATSDNNKPGRYTFDRQVLPDVGVCPHLLINQFQQIYPLTLDHAKYVTNQKKRMRCHVAKHILVGKMNDPTVCGFC